MRHRHRARSVERLESPRASGAVCRPCVTAALARMTAMTGTGVDRAGAGALGRRRASGASPVEVQEGSAGAGARAVVPMVCTLPEEVGAP